MPITPNIDIKNETPKSKKKFRFNEIPSIKTITPDVEIEPIQNHSPNSILPIKKRLYNTSNNCNNNWVGTLNSTHKSKIENKNCLET